jgi:hypothetical protein
VFFTADVTIESLPGAFVTLEELHTSFVDKIDWLTNTSYKVMGTFW